MQHIALHQHTDEELVSQYRKTLDKTYVGYLYKRYATLLYGLCFKYLKDDDKAKDAVIEIFELLMDKLVHADVSYFKSWLYIVSKNHLLRIIRKASREAVVSYDEMEEKKPGVFMENTADDALNIEFDSIQAEDSLVREAIASLKPHQQICVDCFFIKGMSYQQTAVHTGLEIKEVKSHLQNGKRNLKIYLESKGYSYGRPS